MMSFLPMRNPMKLFIFLPVVKIYAESSRHEVPLHSLSLYTHNFQRFFFNLSKTVFTIYYFLPRGEFEFAYKKYEKSSESCYLKLSFTSIFLSSVQTLF